VPTAVTVATPVPAEPESPAVPAAWMKDDAPGVLRRGSRRAAAMRIPARSFPDSACWRWAVADARGPRVAGPDLRRVYRAL
jgi:hypothetical protein